MPALDMLSKVLLLFSGICSVVGLGVSIGMYLTKIRTIEAKSNKLDTAMQTVKNQLSARLYRDDGAPIYMSTVQCKECRIDCQAQRRQDIEDVKNQLDEIKKGVNKIIDMHLKKVTES